MCVDIRASMGGVGADQMAKDYVYAVRALQPTTENFRMHLLYIMINLLSFNYFRTVHQLPARLNPRLTLPTFNS